jgi:hypothetical protein
MPRAKQADQLARRAALLCQIEQAMDKLDAHPSPALAAEISSLSADVDRIDKKLAAATRRRARKNAA